MLKEEITEIEKILGFKNKTPQLLQTAFTHRSYLNEHPDYKNPSNERLEFLGDAVLQFLITEFLYREYPQYPEGTLTSIRAATVNTLSLAEEARRLQYGNFLLLSRGEEDSGGRTRDYILANTFEAVLGYLFLEHGIRSGTTFLKRNLFYKIEQTVKNEAYRDFKSTFQELSQENKGATPNYEVLEEWGPDHDKRFKIGLFIGKTQYGTGTGASKQKAEQAAAKDGLENWKKASIM